MAYETRNYFNANIVDFDIATCAHTHNTIYKLESVGFEQRFTHIQTSI